MTIPEIESHLARLRPQHPQETGLRAGETVRILEELLLTKRKLENSIEANRQIGTHSNIILSQRDALRAELDALKRAQEAVELPK